MTQPNERLATMEARLQHLEEDMSDNKDTLCTMSQSLHGIDLAITKLTVLVESNQDLDDRVGVLEKRVAKIGGMLLVFTTFIGIYGEELKVFLGTLQ